MLTQTFPQFSLLPIELRFHIYILASQPRFIHIREVPSEDYEDFLERFASDPPFNTQLHSSLAYFSHEWRHTIPRKLAENGPHLKQTLLTSHSFTTTKPLHQPWRPTPTCPSIPLHTLQDSPSLLYALTRTSYLTSSAPIPPFLHVSRESRHYLMTYGYELAFSTRTQGPRTWVCWKDDFVYLEGMCFDNENEPMESLVISREPWGLGVFMPEDLRKVKRVALERYFCQYRSIEDSLEKFARLCGGLEELFIVEQNLENVFEDEGADKSEDECEEGRYWGWVECDEADALNDEAWGSSWYGMRLECVMDPNWGPAVEYNSGKLVEYKRRNGGDSSGFFADLCQGYERDLRMKRDEIVRKEGVAAWKIPSMKIVHVGKMAEMKKLFELRRRYWTAVAEKELKELERGVPFAERVPIQRPLSPYSLAWKDDIEAYEDMVSQYYY